MYVFINYSDIFSIMSLDGIQIRLVPDGTIFVVELTMHMWPGFFITSGNHESQTQLRSNKKATQRYFGKREGLRCVEIQKA